MDIVTTAGIATGPTLLGSVVQIPFDPATDLIYVLVALALFVIWYGDRQARRARREDDDGTPDSESAEEPSAERAGSGGKRRDATG